MSEWTPVFALAGTLFGGAGLEITRRWLTRSKDKDDTATELRKELREELANLKDELNKAENELDTWKERYWKLKEESITKPR